MARGRLLRLLAAVASALGLARPSTGPHPLRGHPVFSLERSTAPGTTGASAFSFSVPGSVVAGNGDLGLVLGSLEDGPGLTLALGKNDFWGTFGHVFFGGTFEHFAPGFLTLGVGRATTPGAPAAGWNPRFHAAQRLRDGRLTATSADQSAASSGGGYSLRAEAYVLSSRDAVLVNATVRCPVGVSTTTMLANLSAQNPWQMPLRASRRSAAGGGMSLELLKHNRPSPTHPAVLASCTDHQLTVNGLRTFALTGSRADTIAIANGSDTMSLCLVVENGTRVHTGRCDQGTPRWTWDAAKRRISASTPAGHQTCLAVVNTKTTKCPSSFRNQPTPKGVPCGSVQFQIHATRCEADANTSITWDYLAQAKR